MEFDPPPAVYQVYVHLSRPAGTAGPWEGGGARRHPSGPRGRGGGRAGPRGGPRGPGAAECQEGGSQRVGPTEVKGGGCGDGAGTRRGPRWGGRCWGPPGG